MFPGYLAFGGNEVMNQDLTYTLVELSDCPAGWIRCKPCPGLTDALGNIPAENTVENAPWFDADDPATGRFYGFYPIDVEGAEGSTRTATIVEGIMDGGVVQGTRRAVRTIRVRGIMIGAGHDALDAGLGWLDSVLDGDSCGTHLGGSCGEVDMCFFITCPPPRGFNEDGSPWSDEQYDEILDPLWRRIHGATTISGPLVLNHFHNERYHAYEVEFTIAATTPYVFNLSKSIELTPTAPSVVQDTPFNLTPYPSAELSSGTFVVATNYALNPSVETNATGWNGNAGAISGPVPTVITTARTTAISANGVASFQVRLNAAAATATNAVGYLQAYQDVTVSGFAAGTRLSFTEWGAVQSLNANATVNNLRLRIQWYNASNVMVGTETVIDAGSFNGVALPAKSLPIPATATYVRVVLITEITWSTGADVSLYADALAVTVP